MFEFKIEIIPQLIKVQSNKEKVAKYESAFKHITLFNNISMPLNCCSYLCVKFSGSKNY